MPHPVRLVTMAGPDFNRVRVEVPSKAPGEPNRLDWANDHMALVVHRRNDPESLLVYSDASQFRKNGRRKTGYGVVGYYTQSMAFQDKGKVGHMEVCGGEMKALQVAAQEINSRIDTLSATHRPKKIFIFSDDAGSIERIIDPRKNTGRRYSREFRKQMGDLLRRHQDTDVVISWCPSHSNIPGNDYADLLARAGALGR
jgi:ribonuclease HI